MTNALDVLGDPVRRRILELLADGELSSGAIVDVIRDEFGISQPAVSQHLRVLRESGLVASKPEGARRLYTIEAAKLHDVDRWLAQFRPMWESRLDALGEEIERGKRRRKPKR